ncbi:hypothetical protein M0R45_003406 [Rubus argutus]|uniref:Uncharacterized protein n=1 Tax=Rubus argutus TaxID=59490 RepID=A0AAW1YHQ1_RUBAR
MASWLKAAEDLFEVVDRRAKLVVNELSDEQLASQSLEDSNGQGSQAKRTKKKTKAQKRQSISESPETISHNKIESTETSDSAREQINILSPQVDTTPEKGSDVHLNDNDGTPYENSMIQRINKQQQDLEKDSTASIPSTETPGIGVSETDAGQLEASQFLLIRKLSHQLQMYKNKDQLEEAQGLLKTAVSTGQSKEARFVHGLSSRLQEYKSENAQLEELLVSERELSSHMRLT